MVIVPSPSLERELFMMVIVEQEKPVIGIMETRSKRRRCVTSSLLSSSAASSSSASSSSSSQAIAVGSTSEGIASLRIRDIPRNVLSWVCTFLPAASICHMATTCRFLYSVAIMRSSCPALIESQGHTYVNVEIPPTIVRWQPHAITLSNHTLSELSNLGSLRRANIALRYGEEETTLRLNILSNLTSLELEDGQHLQEWLLPTSLLELTVHWDICSHQIGGRFDGLRDTTNLRRFSAPHTRVLERHFLDLSPCAGTLEYLQLGKLRVFESLLRDPRRTPTASLSSPSSSLSLSSSSLSCSSSKQSGAITFASLTELNVDEIEVTDAEETTTRLLAHFAAIPTLRKVYKFSLYSVQNDTVVDRIRDWCRVQALHTSGFNLIRIDPLTRVCRDWTAPPLSKLVIWCNLDPASMDLDTLHPLRKSLVHLVISGHLLYLWNRQEWVFDKLQSLAVPDNCRLWNMHTDSTLDVLLFPTLTSLSSGSIRVIGSIHVLPRSLTSLSVCARSMDCIASHRVPQCLKLLVLKSLPSLLHLEIDPQDTTSRTILQPYRTLIDSIMRYRRLNPLLVGSKELRLRERRQWEAVFPRTIHRELRAILP